MKVAIHQPEYLPCLALLAKAAQADLLVLLDDVQFNRESLQQRARICDAAGRLRWLTIPFAHRFPQAICDVAVADPKWGARHAAIVAEAYRGAPYAATVLPALDTRIFRAPTDRVAQIAEISLNVLMDAFSLTAPRVRSSDLGVSGRGDKSDGVLAICKQAGATCYVTGRSGAAYLDETAFGAAGVAIETTRYRPVAYRAAIAPHLDRGVSAIDAWMHLPDPRMALGLL